MGFLRQCVYGAAIGDAMGVPYELMSRGSFECNGMTARTTSPPGHGATIPP